MRREVCGGCDSPDLEPFLDLGKTPLADRFPASPDEPEQWYPLEVVVCRQCWLVQLLEVVPDDILWADYGFYSGASPSKVAYHREYAAWALEEFGEQARRLTVEIACNDGDLLQHFHAAGCKVHGIDPAEGPAELARMSGLPTIIEPFSLKLAQQIRDQSGPAGLIIANHVAAHVADPNDFFAGVADLLAPDGVALIEVQYLPDLLAGNQFDHVYHEHRFFYSHTSFSRIVVQHGLRVAHLTHTNQQGGSVRFELRHGENGDPHDDGGWLYEEHIGIQQLAMYASFQGRVNYLRDRIGDLLCDEQRIGRRMAGYGATAKSTTLLNYCGIGPDLLEYVEDKTPHKIGRVTPGTHIPIVAPGEREHPDTFLLLAWNYLSGILRREQAFLFDRQRHHDVGRLLVPIPVPVLL